MDLPDIRFVVEAFGIAVYIYIIYVLCSSKNKIFRSSFYNIFVVGGFIDVIMAVAIVFLGLNKVIGLCMPWEMVIRIASTLTGTNFIAHVFLNMMMTVNRFSAVHYPTKHEQMWRKSWYIPVMVLSILASFGVGVDGLSVPFRMDVHANGTCSLQGRSDIKITRIASGCSVIVFEALCLILSPLTIRTMTRLKREFNTRKSSQEANLAFFSLIKCVIFSFELVYEIIKMYDIDTTDNFILRFIKEKFTLYFYFLVIFNGPTLIILSISLRKEIISRWKVQKSSPVISLPSSPNYNQPVGTVFQLPASRKRTF